MFNSKKGVKISTNSYDLSSDHIKFIFDLEINQKITSYALGISSFCIFNNSNAWNNSNKTIYSLMIDYTKTKITNNTVTIYPILSLDVPSPFAGVTYTCIITYSFIEEGLNSNLPPIYLNTINNETTSIYPYNINSQNNYSINFISGFRFLYEKGISDLTLSSDINISNPNNNTNIVNIKRSTTNNSDLNNKEPYHLPIGVILVSDTETNNFEKSRNIKLSNTTNIINYTFKNKISDFAFLITDISFTNTTQSKIDSFYCNFKKGKNIKLLSDKQTVYGELDFGSNLNSSTDTIITYVLFGIVENNLIENNLIENNVFENGFIQLTSGQKYSSPAIAIIENTNTYVQVVCNSKNRLLYSVNNFTNENNFIMNNISYTPIFSGPYWTNLKGTNPSILTCCFDGIYYIIVFYSTSRYTHYVQGVINLENNSITFNSISALPTTYFNCTFSYCSTTNMLLLSYCNNKNQYLQLCKVSKKNSITLSLIPISELKIPYSDLSFKDIYLYYVPDTSIYYTFLCSRANQPLFTVYTFDSKSTSWNNIYNGVVSNVQNDGSYSYHQIVLSDDGKNLYVFYNYHGNRSNGINYDVVDLNSLLKRVSDFHYCSYEHVNCISYSYDNNKIKKTTSIITNNMYYQTPIFYKGYLLLFFSSGNGDIYMGKAIFNANDNIPYFQ